MKIGILALQGDVEKHQRALEKLDAEIIKVRTMEDLKPCAGLVIPGGESTTIGKLLDRFQILEPLREKILKGFPVFGTCAGTILLAKTIESSDQFRLGTMDMKVNRNAYGRQIESFETEIKAPFLGDKALTAVFIRAPIITHVEQNIKVLLSYEDKPVLVQQEHMLAGTFHPELTEDTRVQEYFINNIVKKS